MTICITSPEEWGASPGSLPTARMRLPGIGVYLHHSVTGVSVHPGADMRAIERVGLERFGQFPYSYCIHPDGTILEGCGDRVGTHTAQRNTTTFGICLIGNYQDRAVKVQQLDSVRWLIAHLIATDKLRPGVYPTGGHRDVKPTVCPGDNAYRLLDIMRIPWSQNETPKEPTMPDDPNVPNITGPLTFHPIVSSDGYLRGYVVFSPTTGELHTWSGVDPAGKPYVPYHGRSEDIAP